MVLNIIFREVLLLYILLYEIELDQDNNFVYVLLFCNFYILQFGFNWLEENKSMNEKDHYNHKI